MLKHLQQLSYIINCETEYRALTIGPDGLTLLPECVDELASYDVVGNNDVMLTAVLD